MGSVVSCVLYSTSKALSELSRAVGFADCAMALGFEKMESGSLTAKV